MSNGSPLVPPLVPPLPLAEVVRKSLLLNQKHGKSSPVPPFSPLFREKDLLNNKEEKIEGNNAIEVTYSKKGGTGEPLSTNLVDFVDEFPYLQLTEVRGVISDLMDIFSLTKNRQGLSDLMRRYRDIRVDFWDAMGRLAYPVPAEKKKHYCPTKIFRCVDNTLKFTECRACLRRMCERYE